MWIAEESNMRVDKMSMAHSLEVRAPFLDHTLVSQAMSIPFTEKVTWREGKRLLKDTFEDVLPEAVLNRPKWGWLSPVHYWINDTLWNEARSLITWLPETGLFSREVVHVLDEYPSPIPQKDLVIDGFCLMVSGVYRQ